MTSHALFWFSKEGAMLGHDFTHPQLLIDPAKRRGGLEQDPEWQD
jgi:hypothetical protein